MNISDKVRCTLDNYNIVVLNKDELVEYQQQHKNVIFKRLEPDYEYFLGELLAIIHRDGGHYQGEYGTKKAVEDAIDIVYHMHLLIDENKL